MLFHKSIFSFVTTKGWFIVPSDAASNWISLALALLGLFAVVGVSFLPPKGKVFTSRLLVFLIPLFIIGGFFRLKYAGHFSNIYLLSELKYFDLLLGLIGLQIFTSSVALCFKDKPTENKKIDVDKLSEYFIVDDPLSQSREGKTPSSHRESIIAYYPGEYEQQASAISKLLPPAYLREKSYAVGIVGERGKGKTSFLNCLINELKKDKPDLLVIRFTPWLYDSPEKIINAFFQDLVRHVQDPVLDSMLADYSSLLDDIDNHYLIFLRNFLFKSTDAEEQREKNI